MKLDYKKGDFGNLYDAKGNLIKAPRQADTETGIVNQIKFQNGKPVVNHKTGEAVEEKKQYPAPLRWEPFK